MRITSRPGETFVDRMIRLVEGASRQKTPNEIALNILLASLTIIFLVVVLMLDPDRRLSRTRRRASPVLVALLVCLIPTTIGALLSAIGIAGMDRLVQRNVLAMSGRAVEAAGDVTTLLLDKTGTITYGNRQRQRVPAAAGGAAGRLARAAALASLGDPTPEGRSISISRRAAAATATGRPADGRPVHRADADERRRPAGRQRDPQGRRERRSPRGRPAAPPCARRSTRRSSASPRRAAPRWSSPSGRGGVLRLLGVVHLKDVVKAGIKERFADAARDGHPHGHDHRRQPAHGRAIAAEAGVDDLLAEATPENKLALIRQEQEGGHLVAMTGDGTNDAPALAQADVGVAMNTGTSAAKEAGNMVDLDSDPTKLIDIVAIGKQLLITRGALTTFSIANDVAKYFAIIPAMFVGVFPGLAAPERDAPALARLARSSRP